MTLNPSLNANAPEAKTENAPTWLINNIAEASKNARSIYLGYIGFLAYSLLTVVSTTDRQIVLNEPAKLPIINVNVPLNGFFVISPIIAIVVFIYFQIYLNELKKLTEELRRNYPLVEKKKIYPWLINLIDDDQMDLIERVKRFIVSFSFWWALPLTLIVNALWILKKHDLALSIGIGLTPIMGTVIVILFWSHYLSSQTVFKFRQPFRTSVQGIGRRTLLITGIIAELLILLCIPLSFNGALSQFRLLKFLYVDLSYQKLVNEQNKEYRTLYWANLKNLHLEGANFEGAILKKANLERSVFDYAKLSYANIVESSLIQAKLNHVVLLSAKLDSADLSYAQLKHANLQAASLKRANLSGASLAFADLSEADLNHARLPEANLQQANLKRAQLRNANLVYARLDSANLSYARLFRANLVKVSLRFANLSEAELQFTNLREANLQHGNFLGAKMDSVDLSGALLQEADLSGARLRLANLSGARLDKAQLLFTDLEYANLLGTKLDSADLFYAKLDHADLSYARLKMANLSQAELNQCKLMGTLLQHANLSGAILQNSNLHLAQLDSSILIFSDLTGAKNLTVAQLAKTRSLYQATLDGALLKQLQKNHRALLDRPEDSRLLENVEFIESGKEIGK